jgi:uncharacterized membrane protein YsdA (DUF1294 family)
MNSRMYRRNQQRSATVQRYALPALLVAAGLFGALWRILHWDPYLSWVVATGILALFLFRLDKLQAELGGERVPEVVLHMLTLLGGFWGTALGMFAFPRRHKTRKLSFWVVLLLSIVIHLIIASLHFRLL